MAVDVTEKMNQPTSIPHGRWPLVSLLNSKAGIAGITLLNALIPAECLMLHRHHIFSFHFNIAKNKCLHFYFFFNHGCSISVWGVRKKSLSEITEGTEINCLQNLSWLGINLCFEGILDKKSRYFDSKVLVWLFFFLGGNLVESDISPQRMDNNNHIIMISLFNFSLCCRRIFLHNEHVIYCDILN